MNWLPEEGSRVELAPHTDAWMRGARFGTVKHVSETAPFADVKLDRTGHTLRLRPADIAREIAP